MDLFSYSMAESTSQQGVFAFVWNSLCTNQFLSQKPEENKLPQKVFITAPYNSL